MVISMVMLPAASCLLVSLGVAFKMQEKQKQKQVVEAGSIPENDIQCVAVKAYGGGLVTGRKAKSVRMDPAAALFISPD